MASKKYESLGAFSKVSSTGGLGQDDKKKNQQQAKHDNMLSRLRGLASVTDLQEEPSLPSLNEFRPALSTVHELAASYMSVSDAPSSAWSLVEEEESDSSQEKPAANVDHWGQALHTVKSLVPPPKRSTNHLTANGSKHGLARPSNTSRGDLSRRGSPYITNQLGANDSRRVVAQPANVSHDIPRIGSSIRESHEELKRNNSPIPRPIGSRNHLEANVSKRVLGQQSNVSQEIRQGDSQYSTNQLGPNGSRRGISRPSIISQDLSKDGAQYSTILLDASGSRATLERASNESRLLARGSSGASGLQDTESRLDTFRRATSKRRMTIIREAACKTYDLFVDNDRLVINIMPQGHHNTIPEPTKLRKVPSAEYEGVIMPSLGGYDHRHHKSTIRNASYKLGQLLMKNKIMGDKKHWEKIMKNGASNLFANYLDFQQCMNKPLKASFCPQWTPRCCCFDTVVQFFKKCSCLFARSKD